MPADQVPPDLGGWTPAELRSTLQQFSGVGSDHDIDEAIRFLRGVVTVIRRREAADQGHEDPKTLSVFLLSPDAGGHTDLEREPMLDAGLATVAGKVWFVNAAVVSGKAKTLEKEDAASVFCTVTNDLRLGHVPAVVVDPRHEQTQARYYPKGLDEDNDYVPVRLHCADIDITHIFKVIDDVYDQCLVTPTAQPQPNKLWKESGQYCPHVNAEQRVQALLKAAFAREFPSSKYYKVEEEIPGIMGRADLQIAEQNPFSPEKWIYLAVLELKVLRSYSESGKPHATKKNEEAVEKGVRQAGTYRKERGHRMAALCCFDMRKEDDGDKCLKAVSKLAGELEVSLRRWYLYASSELARKAGVFTASA